MFSERNSRGRIVLCSAISFTHNRHNKRVKMSAENDNHHHSTVETEKDESKVESLKRSAQEFSEDSNSVDFQQKDKKQKKQRENGEDESNGPHEEDDDDEEEDDVVPEEGDFDESNPDDEEDDEDDD